MFQVLIGLICLLMVGSAWAETVRETPKATEISLPAVESVKNVNSLCLGYIDGRSSDTARFKLQLEKQLTLEGFKVVWDPKACDVTLVGYLQVNSVRMNPTAALVHRTWTMHPAWASIKLVNANWKTIWERSFEPPLFLTRKGYGDGILNCSVNIARSLAKAKKSK